MEKYRGVVVFEHYFYDLYDQQSENVKRKIDHALYVVSYSKIIPSKFFRQIEGEDGLYEVRVQFESNIYRFFCCFDEGNLVILFNGFQKKSQKTPRQEIDKALNIRNLYYKSKSDDKK